MMVDNTETFPKTGFLLSKSAPTFALLSEQGESVDIDLNTGLPKLPLELPVESMDSPGTPRARSFTGGPNLSPNSGSKKTPAGSQHQAHSPLVYRKASGDTHMSIEPSKSMDVGGSHIKRGRSGRHTLPLNRRSRSVFIKLQLPNPRTPPLPHRNLSILGESDSDTDIQTAPVIDAAHKPFFSYDEGRRASEGVNPDRKLDLAELNDAPDESPPTSTSQILADTSPSQTGYNNTVGRRGSYLYLSDADDDEQQLPTRSRASSMSSHIGDETYITPFAQILANLLRVRSQFLALFSLPPETRTTHTKPVNPHNAPSPLSSPPKKLPEALEKKLAMQTLEEFDWCLKKLESMNSASMGTLAQDKFRRMLSRELSNMSGKSKSGTNVAEWVHNITDLDEGTSVVDRALDTVTSMSQDHGDQNNKLYCREARLSGSAHDMWGPKSKQGEAKTRNGEPDTCIRVPMFGVAHPDMDKKAMREFMVHKMATWDVDTFYLNTISGGNALTSAAYLIFKKRDLFSTFKISPHLFINFISKIQNSYMDNPYHNQVHGADVLLATNYLLKAEALTEVFTELEIMAALVAAAIHDVGHPARTNQFLVNVQHELAVLYNDNSVLENHHLHVAFKVLQDHQCNFLENFDRDQRQAFRKIVIDMVLATDMAKHFKHLAELKTLLETHKVANDGILILDKYSERSEVLQCMLHCADLSNPTKRDDLAANWSNRIMEENFLQGDEEKSLGIPLNPLGDREQVSLCKCQVTFIDFIVYPLWETWAELVYPAGQLMLENIAETRKYWHEMIDPNSPSPSEQDSSEEDTKLVNGPEKVAEVMEKIEIVNDQCSVASENPIKKYDSGKNTLESPTDFQASERRHSFKEMKKSKALIED